jgi:hypothetical protein
MGTVDRTHGRRCLHRCGSVDGGVATARAPGHITPSGGAPAPPSSPERKPVLKPAEPSFGRSGCQEREKRIQLTAEGSSPGWRMSDGSARRI